MSKDLLFEDINKFFSSNLNLSKLQNSSILITGATGLIGSTLVEVLMNIPNQHCNVFALGRNISYAKKIFSKYWNDSSFTFIEQDITTPLHCDKAFDYIIHAASGANPKVFSENPVGIMRSNFIGTDLLWQYGLEHGLKKFLYISSGEVYGQGNGDFCENDSGYVNPLEQRSCYPSSKRASENLCISYANQYNKETVIVRPCHVYGENFTETDDRAFAQFFRKIIKNEDIVLKSVGNQLRSWIYEVDCATAILFALLNGRNCMAYNIADKKSNVTIRDFAEIIARTVNKKVIFELSENVKEQINNSTPIKTATFNTEALKNLGWSPIYNIETGVKRTIEVLKEREA